MERSNNRGFKLSAYEDFRANEKTNNALTEASSKLYREMFMLN